MYNQKFNPYGGFPSKNNQLYEETNDYKAQYRISIYLFQHILIEKCIFWVSYN